jgi:DNA topoisomerase-2
MSAKRRPTQAPGKRGSKTTKKSILTVLESSEETLLEETSGRVQEEDVNRYEGHEHAEHVRKRSALYVGSVTRDEREDWHLIKQQDTTYKAVIKKTKVTYAEVHLVREMASNVADNVARSRRKGVDPGECHITVEGGKFTITNGGLCIPIKKRMTKVKQMVKNKDDMLVPVMVRDGKGKLVPVYEKVRAQIYVPEECFAVMLSGSNLGEDRQEGGAHGIGAKAANILGSSFGVSIKNPVTGESYYQTWENGPDGRTDPIIGKYKGQASVISVWYTIDHKYFGYTKDTFKYSKSALQMFHWVAANLSWTAGIPVTFNGIRMDYDSDSYGKLYQVNDCKMLTILDDNKKIILLDTPCNGVTVSFANNIVTPKGGAHVKSVLTAIKELVLNTVNKRTETRNEAKSSGKKGKDGSIKATDKRITIATIRQHITVIFSVTGIKEPKWDDGQLKTTMNTHVPVEFPKEAKEIKKWGIVEHIDMLIRSKLFKEYHKMDVGMRRGRHMKTKYGDDAEYARTKNFEQARLIMVEGLSAEGCVAEMMDFLKGGKKCWGIFTMGGKPLNVWKASQEKFLKNEAFRELVRRLGIELGLDYKLPENYKKLSYGGITIMTDADIDGVHIKIIIIGFLEWFAPSLLQIPGYVTDFWNPYKRATKGNKVRKFYYEKQFNDWKQTPDSEGKWLFKYFKGLGSSRKEDIIDCVQHKKEIKLIHDPEAHAKILLSLAGDKETVQMRQIWMRQYDPNHVDTVKKKIEISTFTDQFYRAYLVHTIGRNMPQMIDGQTNIGRKLVFGSFHVFGRQCTSTKEPKVPEFAGKVSNRTVYHHGDSILKSVINCAQAFCGTNNLPLIQGVGRYGNIEKGGKHSAAPRYLNVKANPLLPLIMVPADDDQLDLNEEEGILVEPKSYHPIIPLALVNGVQAVCSGWKSFIPSFHPLELIDSLLNRLDGKAFVALEPWSRGYIGKLYIKNGEFFSEGIHEMTDVENGDYTLSCLPLGVWNHKHNKQLKEYVLSGVIKDYSNGSSATKTYFKVVGHKAPVSKVLKGKPASKPDEGPSSESLEEEVKLLTLKDIGVVKREVLNNMCLVGSDGFPKTYMSIEEILEDFYVTRLPLFERRKANMLDKYNRELRVFEEKAKYIKSYMNGDFDFKDKAGNVIEEEDLIPILESLGLNSGFHIKHPGYKELKPRELTNRGLSTTKQSMDNVKKQIKYISKKSSEDLWRTDLLALREAYVKIYPDDQRIIII